MTLTAAVLAAPDRFAATLPLPPPEFDWRDYAAMLLHIAAEIEHALMVEYLFAAYSLGGPDVPESLRPKVREWQEVILGIAKEEMGHLVTVQNVLTAIGAPMNLDREDYPFGSPFYPFRFSLEALSLGSLAAFVVAESPPDWEGDEADEIRARAADDEGADVIPVEVLYTAIIKLLADEHLIPNTVFQAQTVPYQASWDEWGRGYGPGAEGPESANVPGTPAPDLLILEIWSRDSAVVALKQVSEQGEGLKPSDDFGGERSHFDRFLGIYREMVTLDDDELQRVTRPVASNPRTGEAVAGAAPGHAITDPEALAWAHLFNLRYRMLLTNLSHAFVLAGPAEQRHRGRLIHRTFAEMYNLRAISGMLVMLPLGDPNPDDLNAGPPFEMPYTLALAQREHDRLLLERDLLRAAGALVASLRPLTSERGERYLTALDEADRLALAQLEVMLR
ncbi:MAG TPA: ferritin-like domain-containing protein [Solirubrobacteraceae bacterium]|nr:ferritin-like domain-containing protein [Solirubrobacteraceae bacterium]